eukprot:scaffold326546_cov31-Prasinocladus_malaysianus.AAC.1
MDVFLPSNAYPDEQPAGDIEHPAHAYRHKCSGSVNTDVAGKRAALPSATIMLRQPINRFAQMQASDIDIYRTEVRKMNREIVELLSKHTNHETEKIEKDILRPKYFDPYAAVDYGIIDKVRVNTQSPEVLPVLRHAFAADECCHCFMPVHLSCLPALECCRVLQRSAEKAMAGASFSAISRPNYDCLLRPQVLSPEEAEVRQVVEETRKNAYE